MEEIYSNQLAMLEAEVTNLVSLQSEATAVREICAKHVMSVASLQNPEPTGQFTSIEKIVGGSQAEFNTVATSEPLGTVLKAECNDDEDGRARTKGDPKPTDECGNSDSESNSIIITEFSAIQLS